MANPRNPCANKSFFFFFFSDCKTGHIISQCESIIQFRNMGISQLFLIAAHQTAADMRKIADKTERETASMHIITLVTLIFLPGTFVAVSSSWPCCLFYSFSFASVQHSPRCEQVFVKKKKRKADVTIDQVLTVLWRLDILWQWPLSVG